MARVDDFRRSPGLFANEVPLTVVEMHDALTRIAAGIHDVIRAVTVDVRHGYSRSAGRILQWTAVEIELAIVEAHKTRHLAIGNRDIRIAVAVQIPDGRVSRLPLRIAVVAANNEVSFTVVEQNQLRIRLVVAQHHVQVAAARHVRQGCRVALDGFARERWRWREMSLAVPEKHTARHPASAAPSPARYPDARRR